MVQIKRISSIHHYLRNSYKLPYISKYSNRFQNKQIYFRSIVNIPDIQINNMEYENYTLTSKVYDNTRVPIGIETLIIAMEKASNTIGKPVKELSLLDIGCGTGNYISEVKHIVKNCIGIEINKGMLSQAKMKHLNDPKVKLIEGSVLKLPFEDSSQDVVIMTQVLHHLNPDKHTFALAEIIRVLKEGGVFWINTQTPHQHMDGFWWTPIIPQASSIVASRFNGEPTFISQLEKAGFNVLSWDINEETLMTYKEYSDIMGPFSKIYRDGDSTWSVASDEELRTGLEWWKNEIKHGRAELFFAEREKKRKIIGQTSSVTSQKPIN